MAVSETPLGFKVPDGNDPIRNGDNHIAANALRAQELLDAHQAKLAALERAAGGDQVELTDEVVTHLLDTPSSFREALDDRYAATNGGFFTIDGGTP